MADERIDVPANHTLVSLKGSRRYVRNDVHFQPGLDPFLDGNLGIGHVVTFLDFIDHFTRNRFYFLLGAVHGLILPDTLTGYRILGQFDSDLPYVAFLVLTLNNTT